MNPLDIIKEQKALGLVEDLILDNIKIKNISEELKTEIQNLPELICLSLNSTELESLKNFPNLPSLIRLELINNKFPPSELKHILNCSSVQSLSLSNNSIEKIEDLEILVEMEDLIQLDLEETKFSQNDNYRKEIFGVFKKLKILDNKDVDGNFFDYESGEEGEEDSEEKDSEGEESDNANDEDDDSEGSDYNGEDDEEENDEVDYQSENDNLKKLKNN